ncbi:MAG: ATP synthase F1 subunit delta [Saprospiraceae bacterium]
MSQARIATRYAKSLIDLAKDQNKLDLIFHDVQQVQTACKNKDFLMLCKSPIVPSGKKSKVYRILFEKILDPLSFSFFDILLRKGRESNMPEIADEFVKQYEEMNHNTRVRLTTAEKLDAAIVGDLESKLQQSSTTRDNITIETKVRPDIIGGFILEYEDKLYDASVSNQLRLVRKKLLSQN